MATKRKRGDRWEFVVKRKGVLPRPLYLTFASEDEGAAYCRRLEGMLDRGIVPDEIRQNTGGILTIADAIAQYQAACSVSKDDVRLLGVQIERIGAKKIAEVDYGWCESFVASMKRGDFARRPLNPSTIRHHVGALRRCLDWLVRKHPDRLPGNPLTMLPKGFAIYNAHDTAAAEASGYAAQEDEERDRRLLEGEEPRIRQILAGAKPAGRQRAMALKHQRELVVLFDLALESAMRLREMYTLGVNQVDFTRSTIFLDRTKNGHKRQVPMTSIARRVLADIIGARTGGEVFPWWNGDLSDPELQRVTSLLSRQYARIFDAAGCDDLRFHDLRHEAISRLYERTTLDSTVIRKMVGHISQKAHDRYVNLRVSSFADKLW